MTGAELAAGGVPSGVDLEDAAKHMRAICEILGIVDVDRVGVEATPLRFVRALDELTAGRRVDPRRHLAVTFPAEGDIARPGAWIVVRDMPVVSICEHHLLPFSGTVAVGYVPQPGTPIVGLSKLARVATEYAARATVQERVTVQIADAIEDVLTVAGVAVVMKADHSCMSLRGARALGAGTVTEVFRGVYLDPGVAARFLRSARIDQ